VSTRVEQAAYLVALGRLRGVGARTVTAIARSLPSPEQLLEAPEAELRLVVGSRSFLPLTEGLAGDWSVAWASATRHVEEHLARGITPIPFMDAAYPPLLRLIKDPPPILYARGREDVLTSTTTIAVVGTRNPTQRGLAVAHRVAQWFAEAGFVIVSGLAKGIDTAAHEGALGHGRTVAVLGTPLDKIYPAENKHLAGEIAETGALVSEYPIGFASHGQSFVERDRIQAGMSIAVVPVQTGLEGGTQHTIRFAEEQGRLILCPRPLAAEQDAPEYAGIHQLIESGRARAFEADDYADLLVSLALLERDLSGRAAAGGTSPRGVSKRTSKHGKAARSRSEAPSLSLFVDAVTSAEADPEP
jgi:DNA processing protein